MKPSESATVLRAAIAARAPIMLLGRPGVGKTSVCREVAAALGYETIVCNLPLMDVGDTGIPWFADGHVSYHMAGPLGQAFSATAPTLLLLDDFSQAPASIQAMSMPLILDRRIHDHILPDCVAVVATGNDRSGRNGVQGLFETVRSRYVTIIPFEANLDDWYDFGCGAGYDFRVLAFVRFQPSLLSTEEPPSGMENFPCPRTWEHVSQILSWHLPEDIEHHAVCGSVGTPAAVQFRTFCRNVNLSGYLDRIIADPAGTPLPDAGKPGLDYAIAAGLAAKAEETTVRQICAYAVRWHDAGRIDMSHLISHDAARRWPAWSAQQCVIKLITEKILPDILNN